MIVDEMEKMKIEFEIEKFYIQLKLIENKIYSV